MRQLLIEKYLFPFAVILFLLSLSSCEKKYDSVIDPSDSAPVAMDAFSSISIINTDTINIGDVRKPDDLLTILGVASIRIFHPQGKKEISAVKYSIMIDQSSSLLEEGVLNDEGIFPDRIANDSIYSGYVQFQIERVFVGKLILSLWSESQTGQLSNTVLMPVYIVRANQPPIIFDPIAPSIVDLATTKQFNISIKVIDPDGQSDIKSVTRFTPSGKRAPLYTSNSNDSIYAETVDFTLTTPPDTGSYIFRFRAVDRSNDSSNVKFKTIVIIKTTSID